MTNRTVSAKEALEWNVVNRVYDEANFEKNVDIIARELAAGPTHLQGIARLASTWAGGNRSKRRPNSKFKT